MSRASSTTASAKAPTETQLVLLTAAVARPGRSLLPPPASLKVKGAALQRVLVGLLKGGLAAEQTTKNVDATWRIGEDGRRHALVISRAGLQVLGLEADDRETTKDVRPGTKTATVLALLRSDGGATLAELMQATGWQAHSVRGFLSATVRRKLSLTLIVETGESGRHYRIAA